MPCSWMRILRASKARWSLACSVGPASGSGGGEGDGDGDDDDFCELGSTAGLLSLSLLSLLGRMV